MNAHVRRGFEMVQLAELVIIVMTVYLIVGGPYMLLSGRYTGPQDVIVGIAGLGCWFWAAAASAPV